MRCYSYICVYLSYFRERAGLMILLGFGNIVKYRGFLNFLPKTDLVITVKIYLLFKN